MQKDMLQKIVPPDDDALSRHVIESLRAGKYEEVEALLDPSLNHQDTLFALRGIHDVLSNGEPNQTELIGCRVNNVNILGSGGSTLHRSTISYQMEFAHAWAEGEVVVDTRDGVKTIGGIHFSPTPASLETMNRFTFTGKSQRHYFFFFACILIPLFVLYSLVTCFRTPIARRKWLWVIFILFPVSQFRLNWTTGVWDFQPFSVDFLGAEAISSGIYRPWVLAFALPIGAIIFLIRRKRMVISSVGVTE